MASMTTRRNSLSNSSNSNHNNKNKPNALQKMNPMMWRQARTIKKAVEMVDEFVSNMTKGAPFLESTKATPKAVFHRSEIVIGNKLLGEGSFSTVSEILHFQLQADDNTNMTDFSRRNNNNNNNNPLPFTPQEAARRKELQHLLQDDKQQGTFHHRYALKQIKRDLLRKPNDFGKAIADLVVEAKYLSRFDHPNILALRGMAKGGINAFLANNNNTPKFDSYFLVLDRLTDCLDQRIEQWQRLGPPDPIRIPRKTNYALQIANALLYLHRRRIIYRDLKPENVGFQGEHIVQLFDFGLVREIPQGYDDEQYSMSGSGTQWYMAAEIFVTGKYNLKADVYSWAMTFYEMLTESKPFAKMHKLQHVAMVCVKGKRPSLSTHELPQGVESIIRAAWGQSVAKRPNILEVARTLEKLIPDLGDDEACSWPTVQYDAADDHHPAGEETDDDEAGGAETDDDINDALSLGGGFWGDDHDIDDIIMKEMKQSSSAAKASSSSKSKDAQRPTLGDVDEFDNDYSLSSMMFGDH